MRAVVQRVRWAAVSVDGAEVGRVGAGFLVLLGVEAQEVPAYALELAGKVARLRVFEDTGGKMNRSLQEISGAALVISQFTLCADTRKGNRPSFIAAARPETAKPLYEQFCHDLRACGVPVQTGVFGADMAVTLHNDGPVTLILDYPPAPARQRTS